MLPRSFLHILLIFCYFSLLLLYHFTFDYLWICLRMNSPYLHFLLPHHKSWGKSLKYWRREIFYNLRTNFDYWRLWIFFKHLQWLLCPAHPYYMAYEHFPLPQHQPTTRSNVLYAQSLHIYCYYSSQKSGSLQIGDISKTKRTTRELVGGGKMNVSTSFSSSREKIFWFLERKMIFSLFSSDKSHRFFFSFLIFYLQILDFGAFDFERR